MTPKQQRFVDEFPVDLNATQAAIRAGYSLHTAAAIGCELLAKPEIAAAIRAALAERQRRTAITADRVLEELARVAFVDPRGFFGSDGSLKRLEDLTEEQAAALASLDMLEEYAGSGQERQQIGWVKKIRFWPKIGALRLLMAHLGMLIERHEHSGPDGGPIECGRPHLTDDERAALIAQLLDSVRTRTAGPLVDRSAPAT